MAGAVARGAREDARERRERLLAPDERRVEPGRPGRVRPGHADEAPRRDHAARAVGTRARRLGGGRRPGEPPGRLVEQDLARLRQ